MLNNVKTFLPWQEIEEVAQKQIHNMAGLPIIDGNIAIMPDCHFGKGATVGSVIPTYKAIIPAAVGVDIGCGMEALKLPINKGALTKERLVKLFDKITKHIPLGAGGQHERIGTIGGNLLDNLRFFAGICGVKPEHYNKNWEGQLGTLGSGNHFIEICLDQNEDYWLVLHSGSRGVGNRIGMHYIEQAKLRCQSMGLPDSDLSFLTQGEKIFDDYIKALSWAQNYAFANRHYMLNMIFSLIMKECDDLSGLRNMYDCEIAVSCHHNYVEFVTDDHFITRKGAISAKDEEMGIIPGSMGAKTYIVRGKGNPDSLHSASHGAGRAMSRGQAKRSFTVEDLDKQTEGVICLKDASVLDEIPSAYKDIDTVMERQKDLVEVVYTLKQILNVKGG